MTHSAFNCWFPFRIGACQMISPFWDISLVSIERGRFCWKIVMRQRRLLSYEYITPKIFFQGCTQCPEFDFLIGPKDTVTPVEHWLKHSVLEALLKPRFKIKTNFSWHILQNIITYNEAQINKELENWRFIFMWLLVCQIWPHKN